MPQRSRELTVALAEYIENTICLLTQTELSLRSQCTAATVSQLHAQLEDAHKHLISSGEHKYVGAEYPSVIERWNVFTLCTTIRAHTGHPTALFNEEWRGFLRTFSYGSATARRAVDVAVDHAVSSTSTSVCESVLRALEAYSETLPLCFPSSTQRLKEEASMRMITRTDYRDLSTAQNRTNQIPERVPKRDRGADVCDIFVQAKRRVQPIAATEGGDTPTPTSIQRRDMCQSKFHATFAANQKASRVCKFCVVCHPLEYLFNAYLVKCAWPKHECPPTLATVRQRLRGHPCALRAAEQRILQISQGVPLSSLPRVDLHELIE